MRRLAGLLALFVIAATLVAAAPTDPDGPCTEVPDPSRWESPATPDQGRPDPIIAVHRGAANLAPENTLDAYRYAIAYDVEMIEVDVQQTLDHHYVAFHDLEVDDKTDGSGQIFLMTYEETQALNAADNDKWRGSAYDPARIPALEEVLQLASDTGTGIMFDLKESVTDAASVANMAAEYGVLPNSVFIPYVPVRAEAILAVQPTARLNFSNQFGNLPGNAPTGVLYPLTQEYWSFGSSMPAFDAGDVAEVHDGCSLVIPNVYQGDVTGTEAGDLAYARSIGADGAQVNNPEIAADVLEEPVATTLQVRPDDRPEVCLVDEEHRFGLPGKTLKLGDGSQPVTGKGGCVVLDPQDRAGRIRFAGDGSALPSTTLDTAAP